MTIASQSTPIPVPDDFPVHWESPEEPTLLWQWGNTHWPAPVSPLAMDLVRLGIMPGLVKGLKGMGVPIRDIRIEQITILMVRGWRGRWW